jgi:tripartite-type tricarboxylate transporter receptor subunit TctC
MNSRIRNAAMAVLGMSLATASFAQWLPSRTVTLVVPASSGSAPDLLARQLLPRLTAALGQALIVENRPGASGVIASETVARASGDGTTLLLNYASHVTNPVVLAKLPYDTERAFAPVALLVRAPFVLVSGAHLPISSMADAVRFARQNPGKIEFGIPATGGAIHLGYELLRARSGADMVLVPYKGGANAIQDLLSGRIGLYLDSLNRVHGHAKEGRVRILGITSSQRASFAPEIPPIAEVIPGFDAIGWYGIVAPSSTPIDAVRALNREFTTAVRAPETAGFLSSQGFEAGNGSADDFGRFLSEEARKWQTLIRDNRIKLD